MESTVSEFTLHRLIIHKINKEQKSKEVKKKLSSRIIKGDDEVALEFSQKLTLAYYSKHSLEYSKFNEDIEDEYSFKSLLDNYLSAAEDEKDVSFKEFSQKAIDLLAMRMQEKFLSVGGYIVFGEIELKNKFLYIALVNHTPAFDMEENEDFINLKRKEVLRLDRLGMAAFINLSIYQDDQDDRRYISFLKGLREIADYFVQFLNASEYRLKIKDATKLFVKAIKDFLKTLDLDETEKEHRRISTFYFVDEKLKKNESIDIRQVANILHPDEPEKFIAFYQGTDSNVQLDTVLEKLDRRTLRTLKLFRFSDKDFSLKFDLERYRSNVEVVRDDNGNEFVKITGLSSLIEKLKEEFAKVERDDDI